MNVPLTFSPRSETGRSSKMLEYTVCLDMTLESDGGKTGFDDCSLTTPGFRHWHN